MMHILEAAVLLAFVTTAQGGCTLTRIDDFDNFEGEEVDVPKAKNAFQCARLCYDANKCDAMIFEEGLCYMFALPGTESPLFDSSSKPIGYKVERRASPGCKNVQLI